MPIRHAVMFKWIADIDPGHAVRVGDRLDAMSTAIGRIRAYAHGPDAGLVDGNFDYLVVAEFDTLDDYLHYRTHPEHDALVDDLITAFVDQRATVQFLV